MANLRCGLPIWLGHPRLLDASAEWAAAGDVPPEATLELVLEFLDQGEKRLDGSVAGTRRAGAPIRENVGDGLERLNAHELLRCGIGIDASLIELAELPDGTQIRVNRAEVPCIAACCRKAAT